MPFSGFADFEACVASMVKKGNDDESAKKICGSLQAKTEGRTNLIAENLVLEYAVPLKLEEKIGTKEFTVSGVALEETVSRNGVRYLGEEIEKAAKSLEGKKIIKDHNKLVDNVVGVVTESKYNKSEKKLRFKGKIMDDKMKEMINDGRLDNVSIGATVKELVEETVNDEQVQTARGINFEELSLVVVPGVQAATITQALEGIDSQVMRITEAVKEVETNMENKEIEA